MLSSQHVNIGLMPWSHLSNTAAHADSHSDGQYVQLCLAAQLRLRLWLFPHIPTAPLAASFWKYAPVGYIPAHFSADPAVSGPAGPSLTLSARSSSWWRPLTWSNRLGLLTFRSYLDSSQPPPYNTSYSTLVMGEVFPPMATFHLPEAVRITHSILGDHYWSSISSSVNLTACQHLT